MLAATRLPSLKQEKELLLPEILKIELMAPEQPEELAPEPTPQPLPEPEPPKPKPKPKPEPIPKPKPAPKPEPAPVAEPPPTPEPSEPAVEPAPPPVISAAPVKEKPPVFTAPPPPPPEPPKPRGLTQQDIDSARSQYGDLLGREIAKHKRYPRIAQMRRWQGETVLELQINGNGKVLSSKVQTSSTFDVLDKQALEMVERASPFPLPPAALRGETFMLLVPISFRLE